MTDETVLPSLADAARALSATGLFAALGPDLAGEILAQGQEVTLAADELLFRQGDNGDCAFLVLDGALEVLVGVGGHRISMALLGPNQLVGEIAVFAKQPRTATVIARQPSRLLRLDGDVVVGMIARHPDAGAAVIADLGRRLSMVNQPLAYLSIAARAFSEEDLDAGELAALEDQAGELGQFAHSLREMIAAIQARQTHRREMELAARIQQSLLPAVKSAAPVNPLAAPCAADQPVMRSVSEGPYSISAYMRPTREVGGDLYDFFKIDPGHLAFTVADVSGKGVPASLFMAMFRTVVKAVALPGMGPDQIIGRVNAILAADNSACMFVTVFFGVLDLSTGRMEYVSAGHNPPYVLKTDGTRRSLPSTAIPVGIIPDMSFPPEPLALWPGDRLFLYTDGVTEACAASGEQFGEDRLEALLQNLGDSRPDQLVEQVVAEVDRFSTGTDQFDDITCLALSWKP